MENILSVEETKTRLICELSTVTGFKYLKSGILSENVEKSGRQIFAWNVI